jgi:hypothetical protein
MKLRHLLGRLITYDTVYKLRNGRLSPIACREASDAMGGQHACKVADVIWGNTMVVLLLQFNRFFFSLS